MMAQSNQVVKIDGPVLDAESFSYFSQEVCWQVKAFILRAEPALHDDPEKVHHHIGESGLIAL